MSVTMRYRRSVAAIFGLPMLAVGVAVFIAGLWPTGALGLPPLGRLIMAVGGCVLIGLAVFSWLKYWFVTVTVSEAGVVVTNLFGGSAPTVPWAAVTVTTDREHKRLHFVASSPRLHQPVWPQMWSNFDGAVEWMKSQPHVLERWDSEARDAERESTKARADLKREQADIAERRRGPSA